MIKGIGIDLIEINRFTHWHTLSDNSLQRILTHKEIVYCKSNLHLSASRFAVRFALREAAYKAFSAAFPEASIPFLSFCRKVKIEASDTGVPILELVWPLLGIMQQDISVHVSLAHSKTTAGAVVMLSKSR